MPPFPVLGPRDLAWKLLRRPYYRALYGRNFPGADRLRRGIRAFEERTGRGDAPMRPETWDADWIAGRWSALRDAAEAGRYAAIAERIRAIGPTARVLDVGCGDGALRLALGRDSYRRYDGIDLSAAAIARARQESRDDPRAHFEVADAARFEPLLVYDAIVFNETLYYLEQPEAQARRYAAALAPGGRLIVSTFRSPRADAIGRALVRRLGLPLERRVAVATAGLGQWVIRVFLQPDDGKGSGHGAHTR